MKVAVIGNKIYREVRQEPGVKRPLIVLADSESGEEVYLHILKKMDPYVQVYDA